MKLDPRACSQLLRASNPIRLFGKVNKVVGLVAEGGGLRAPLGAVCHMLPDGESEGIAAEVVGFRDGNLLFMPYGDMRGIRPGSLIRNTSLPPVFPVGPELLDKGESFVLREGKHTHTFTWLKWESLREEYFYPQFLKEEIFHLPDALTLRAEWE